MLSVAQDGMIRSLALRVLAKAERGAGVIGELLDDPKCAAYVRLGAAKAAVDSALRLFEYVGLADRLTDLEQAVKDGRQE